jgi:hypothetical protein
MQHRDGMLPCFQLVRDAIGAVFRSRKNQRAVEVRPFQQRHQQIELLFRRDRINRVRHGFRRRTARADFDNFRIAQNPGGEPLDLRRKRRGKEQRLAISGNFFTIRRTSGRKPMSSMRSTSSSTRIFTWRKLSVPCSR